MVLLGALESGGKCPTASSLHPSLQCVIGNCVHVSKEVHPGKGLERDDLLRGANMIWGTLIYTRKTSALQILKVQLESLESKHTNSQFDQEDDETQAGVAWVWAFGTFPN